MKNNIFKKIQPLAVYLIISFVSQLFFSLIFTVDLLYHVNSAKLNPLQLILVGTVLELSVFLFEIPTGIVADTKSRKLSTIIGYTLMGIGFVIEGLVPSFIIIIIAQLFFGIGYTFTSGATQAWIIDELGEDNSQNVFVKGAKTSQIGGLIAIPLSMAIGLVKLNLPIILGGIGMIFLALFLIASMSENGFKPTPKENQSSWHSILATIKSTKQYIKLNKLFLFLLVIGLLYGLYSEGFDRLWTAHIVKDFNWSLLNTKSSVIVISIIRGVSIILSIIALDMLNKKADLKQSENQIRILFISAIIIILSLIGFGIVNNIYIALILFWIIGIMRSITSPLLDTMLNGIITDSNIRATIFSLRGQVDSIGQIAGGPIVGCFGVLFSIKIALIISGILLSPVLLLYSIILKRIKK